MSTGRTYKGVTKKIKIEFYNATIEVLIYGEARIEVKRLRD